MVDGLIFLLMCAFEIWGYIFFFNIFMDSDKTGKRSLIQYLILYVSVALAVIMATALFPGRGEVIKVPLVIFVLTVFCILFYRADFAQSIFFSAINYVLMLLIELAGACAIGFQIYRSYRLLWFLLRALWLLVLLAMRKYLSDIKGYLCRDNISWIRFAWFLFISVIAGIYFYIYVLSNREIQFFYAFISGGLVVLDIIALFFLQDSLIKNEKIRQSEIMLKKNQNQLQTFEDMKTMYERQGRKLHDYKKQVATVQELLINGAVDSAIKYTEKLTKSIAVELSEINVGHPVFNAVLNQEYRLAKGKGIGFTFSICDLHDVKIKDEDIVVLMGNMLENAIHECEKVKESGEEATISLKLVQNDGRMILSVRNPVLAKVFIQDNNVSGDTGDGHGIGLKNIKEVVENYNGDFEISCDENEFIAVAII